MELIQMNEDESDYGYLYRCVDSGNSFCVNRYKIAKETQYGWWIQKWIWDSGDLKFVYKSGKNNFAKPTREAAIENYYHRKVRQISILKNRIDLTRNRLKLVKMEMNDE